jgi:quinol-cytochrome oxidoreductase complex cytochrome b subunit
MPFRYPVDDTYKVASQEERKMIIGNGRYFVLYCVENNVVCIEYFHDSRRKQ